MNDAETKLQRFGKIVCVLGLIGTVAASWTAMNFFERGRRIAELEIAVHDRTAQAESLKRALSAANIAGIRRSETLQDALQKCTDDRDKVARNLEICGGGFDALLSKRKLVVPNALCADWKAKSETCDKTVNEQVERAIAAHPPTETHLCFPENESGPYLQCHKFTKAHARAKTTVSLGKMTVECEHGPDGYVIPSKCLVVR